MPERTSRYLPDFEHDIFISYAQIDNEPLAKDKQGWVTFFHTALRARLRQILGTELAIWRDLSLQGNVDFSDELVNKLARVATLICVLTPRYVQSQWCLRELREFHAVTIGKARSRQSQNRLFKVIKTLVPVSDQPPEVQHCIGYEFFEQDHQSGKFAEFLPELGQVSTERFFARLEDLVQELAHQLKSLHPRMQAQAAQQARNFQANEIVYLAQTTRDLVEAHDNLRRELHDRGYAVLPDQALPIDDPSTLRKRIRDFLGASQLAILLVGQNYGLIPEGETHSLLEIQHELAQAQGTNVARLIWMPPGLRAADERQAGFIDALRRSDEVQLHADVLETSIDELKQAILQKLRNGNSKPIQNQYAAPHVYLIFAEEDAAAAEVVEQYLHEQHIDVFPSTFDGDESQRSATHRRLLQETQGALIYFNNAPDTWLSGMRLDLRMASGLGRREPMAAQLIYLAGSETPFKKRFSELQTPVVRQFGDFSPTRLTDFVAALRPVGVR